MGDRAGERALVAKAARDMVPMFVPVIPFALVLGVVIDESGVGHLLGWSTSATMFGGAAQITLLSLLGEGASVVAAVSAALIVGARHLLYSANLAPRFQDQPTWFRWVGPYFLIDQVFALSVLNSHLNAREFRVYFLTSGLLFWLLWVSFTALGLFVGPQVPTAWKLAFAAPVLFIGLVVMSIDRWQKALVAVAGGALTFLFADMPSGSGMLLAALTAIAIGLAADALRGPQG